PRGSFGPGGVQRGAGGSSRGGGGGAARRKGDRCRVRSGASGGPRRPASSTFRHISPRRRRGRGCPRVRAMNTTQKAKICLIGATAAGKSSLVARFVRSTFSEEYRTTIGVKIETRRVERASRSFELVIWDLSGEDE